MESYDEAAPETDIPFSIRLDTVCFIIALAHDLQGKTGSSLYADETGAPDEVEAQILEDRGGDPVGAEFDAAIEALTEEAQYDLVALMWLGRDGSAAGDADETVTDDLGRGWSELRALAEQEHTGPTAAYLRGTPLLADYLAAGLAAMGRDCREWERENA